MADHKADGVFLQKGQVFFIHDTAYNILITKGRDIMSRIILEIESLYKTYGEKENAAEALRGISF